MACMVGGASGCVHRWPPRRVHLGSAEWSSDHWSDRGGVLGCLFAKLLYRRDTDEFVVGVDRPVTFAVSAPCSPVRFEAGVGRIGENVEDLDDVVSRR